MKEKTRKCPICKKKIDKGKPGSSHIGACRPKALWKKQKEKAISKIRRRLSEISVASTIVGSEILRRRTASYRSLQARSSGPSAVGHAPSRSRGPSPTRTESQRLSPEGTFPPSPHRHPAPVLRQPRPAFRDILPSIGGLEADPSCDDDSIPWKTRPDTFGLYRVYPLGKPTYTPDAAFTLLHHAEGSATLEHQTVQFNPSFPPENTVDLGLKELDWLGADIFPNVSIALVMRWFYGGQSIISSKQRTDDFIKNVILHPDFRIEDLKGFRVDLGMKALDEYDNKRIEDSKSTPFPIADGWQSSTVYLSAICPGKAQPKKKGGPKQYPVANVMHRKLMDVIMSALREPSAEFFHLAPFKEYYQPPGYGAAPERQYGELYTSDSFLEAQAEVEKIAKADGCPHEVVVAALMLGSDGTLLWNSGTDSLWPIYVAFGNLSKYVRANPSSYAMHHLAYIPKIPDNINDWWSTTFGGKSPFDDSLSHLRCELMQAVWLLLNDKDLLEAYLHGRDSNDFPDGRTRRTFPRFFTYAADYLEKILLICIKNMSTCPCPRCLVSKSNLDQLGTPEDMANRVLLARNEDPAVHKNIQQARNLLYGKGVQFNDPKVVEKLGPKSLRPTRNAFSELFSDLGLNSYDLMAPDLLHEFELGVWKTVFTHLLRILQCEGKLSDLDARQVTYRQFPSFGRTIRKFRNNVSAMAKFTARDFEDVLQCSIPAFEGLIPEPHGTVVRQLLFELCTWHSLAKLRRISDPGTAELEASTVRLGTYLRRFRDDTCPVYDTTTLPDRQSNRSRKKRRATKKKLLNLLTPKIHALGHYPRYIRRKGTSDSYSSQNIERAHVGGKRHRVRGQRAKDKLLYGIATHQRREHLLNEMVAKHERSELVSKGGERKAKRRHDNLPLNELLPPAAPHVHHSMSVKVPPSDQLNILSWLATNKKDPALKDFSRSLRKHLVLRLYGLPFNSDEDNVNEQELSYLIIVNEKMYRHRTMHINYTTYDLRRAQDYINPSRFSVVMMLSNEDYDPDSPNHPYWYAQVLGIFHVRVLHTGPLSKSREVQEMPVLWVRWLALEGDWKFGFQEKHLPKLRFVNEAEDGSSAFGFVDPANVVRTVYLIPEEDSGRSDRGLIGPTMGRAGGIDAEVWNDGLDWDTFWLNIFVDRDMFMRYRGGAPGHAAVRNAVDEFLQDRDAVDDEHVRKRRLEVERQQQLEEAPNPNPPADAVRVQSDKDRAGWGDNMDARSDCESEQSRDSDNPLDDDSSDEDYEYDG